MSKRTLTRVVTESDAGVASALARPVNDGPRRGDSGWSSGHFFRADLAPRAVVQIDDAVLSVPDRAWPRWEIRSEVGEWHGWSVVRDYRSAVRCGVSRFRGADGVADDEDEFTLRDPVEDDATALIGGKTKKRIHVGFGEQRAPGNEVVLGGRETRACAEAIGTFLSKPQRLGAAAANFTRPAMPAGRRSTGSVSLSQRCDRDD